MFCADYAEDCAYDDGELDEAEVFDCYGCCCAGIDQVDSRDIVRKGGTYQIAKEAEEAYKRDSIPSVARSNGVKPI